MLIAKCLIWSNFFFAVMVILAVNTIYIVLNFILIILFSCLFLFMFKIEFLSFVILLLYIGAILILFLFVVMLLNLNIFSYRTKLHLNILDYNYIFIIIVFKSFFYLFDLNWLCFIYFYNIDHVYYWGTTSLDCMGTSSIFLNLLSQKFFFLIIIGASLLVSMVGSILLCQEKISESK